MSRFILFSCDIICSKERMCFLMRKNKFDVVMEYIDANIKQSTNEIKKGILEISGVNSNTFGHCFYVLTGDTLYHYITTRKLFFAAEELRLQPNKPICDIALDFGYSEQSALTRAMRAFYNCTPDQVRKGKEFIPNDKYNLEDIYHPEADSRVEHIFKQLRNNEHVTANNIDYLIELNEISEKYQFDIDVCYQIADLAEKLEIPVGTLADFCFEAYIDVNDDPRYLSPKTEHAIDLGLQSEDELDKICSFYDCKYYDIDRIMVHLYKESIDK